MTCLRSHGKSRVTPLPTHQRTRVDIPGSRECPQAGPVPLPFSRRSPGCRCALAAHSRGPASPPLGSSWLLPRRLGRGWSEAHLVTAEGMGGVAGGGAGGTSGKEVRLQGSQAFSFFPVKFLLQNHSNDPRQRQRQGEAGSAAVPILQRCSGSCREITPQVHPHPPPPASVPAPAGLYLSHRQQLLARDLEGSALD